MSERDIQQREHQNSQETDHGSLEVLATKKREKLREDLELAEKNHKARLSEQEALARAHELAKEEHDKEVDRPTASLGERRRGPISKKQLDASFQSQMSSIQNEMRPSERLISKVIHNRSIEKLSDMAASTIARPNAMLAGSIAAFIVVTVLYFVAKHYGYQLSGFETIGAFVVGWIIGIAYDYVVVALRRRD